MAVQFYAIIVERLQLDQINAVTVPAFLKHPESDQGNRVFTRNCGRIALRLFPDTRCTTIPPAPINTKVLALSAKRNAPVVARYPNPNKI